MLKCFSVSGSCIPGRHYMVDLRGRVSQVVRMVNEGKYFEISRPSCYGKSTLLCQLKESLGDRYYVVTISFPEGIAAEIDSDSEFVLYCIREIAEDLNSSECPPDVCRRWENVSDPQRELFFYRLSRRIQDLCRDADRPVVLLVDNVDHVSEIETFRSFLGVLRANFLRAQAHKEPSFHSVVLAGIEGVGGSKTIVRPDGTSAEYGPWNIASDFRVHMSFTEEEIAGMLGDYEADHHTGMDIGAASRELYRLTSGYPGMVSWLCDWMDRNRAVPWTPAGIQMAGRAFVRSDSVLLTGLRNRLQADPDLRDILYQNIYCNAVYSADWDLPRIGTGLRYGYLKRGREDYRAYVSAPLYEDYLYQYSMEQIRDSWRDGPVVAEDPPFQGGSLDMCQTLVQFQEFFAREYPDATDEFRFSQGRPVFLAFLSAILGTRGQFRVVDRTRNCMSVMISCGTDEYLAEIWCGDWSNRFCGKKRAEALRRLDTILKSRGAESGYLVNFADRSGPRKADWIPSGARRRRIFEVSV